ncbi:hypothetical protein [Actinacidiphila sp. ITFR-21]|uniref:hypothetical protein n=1 Tax=Actinacidiphila sp. ITFR-21 TaxID=3075199 RepID=UPI00288A916A|nr:hypothetical protein [Streptomyces sp. ITFR-21]WNI19908.1 hypothetical protein RLT57_12100 [Streptomyces sp. ITFR-21]
MEVRQALSSASADRASADPGGRSAASPASWCARPVCAGVGEVLRDLVEAVNLGA